MSSVAATHHDDVNGAFYTQGFDDLCEPVCDCHESDPKSDLAMQGFLSLPRASLVRYHSTHGGP